ncbi:MAG: hypothetical protein EPO11_02345 [Gammaproteobacteria bacterium]|nr:MAG: hypothetical protein EPO11_02345 [Gammaproteobacteria bacterium]
MNAVKPTEITPNSSWRPVTDAFFSWLGEREHILKPGLAPEPTMKVLIFLALYDSEKSCTYDDLREIFKKKNVLQGNIPDNTLRTSVMYLGKTLDKFGHDLELKSFRGRFQLIARSHKKSILEVSKDRVVLLQDPPAIKAEDVALMLAEKAVLPFHALYFLERSARAWESYSRKEAEIRVSYESNAWEQLGIKNRLSKAHDTDSLLGVIGLAPGEGLAEIELIKKILRNGDKKKIHYLAVDSSPRLLRNHIGLLKETLALEIESGRLLCSGVVADIFSGLRESVKRVENEFKNRGLLKPNNNFFPSSCGMLITYFGNCLGNNRHNSQDQETEFFSTLYSIFQNRPLEVLVGVSVAQPILEDYKRNWDDFLLQTPKHLMEMKLLKSTKLTDNELPEFILPENYIENNRCPSVVPEPYIVRHQIEGQIYRFYYKLAFDLELYQITEQISRPLPKGTLILLYSIIKYNMQTLANGIEKCGLFKIKYDNSYHHIVDTLNGKREYAVFSAYLEL